MLLIRVVLSIVKSLRCFAVTDGELLALVSKEGVAGLLAVVVVLLVHKRQRSLIIIVYFAAVVVLVLIVWLCHESAEFWLFTDGWRHDTQTNNLRLS